jgi:dynein heavy chain 1, cytosolic
MIKVQDKVKRSKHLI